MGLADRLFVMDRYVNLFGSPLYFITLFWMAATRGQSMFPPGASRSSSCSFVLLCFSLHTSKKKSLVMDVWNCAMCSPSREDLE